VALSQKYQPADNKSKISVASPYKTSANLTTVAITVVEKLYFSWEQSDGTLRNKSAKNIALHLGKFFV
jgi:hypothetical protein